MRLVQGTADSALYEAKHRGGSRMVIKIFELVAPALIAEDQSEARGAWQRSRDRCTLRAPMGLNGSL